MATISSYDVIVIGAGPAGATAGYELAQRGLDVLIIDREKLPRDKTCAGLVSTKVTEIINFDISPVVEQVIYNRTFSFELGEKFTGHSQTPVGYTVRRDRFDYLLAMEAKAAGASIKDREKVERLEVLPNEVKIFTANHTFTAPIIIGADGAYGITARSAGLMRGVETRITMSTNVYAPRNKESWDSAMNMDFGVVTGGYGWIFPKKGYLSVGTGTYLQFVKELKPYVMKLLSSLGLESASVERFKSHPLPTRNPKEPIQRGRILLLGDSAGLTDPFWGEGIFYAMKSAQLAAPVVEKCLKEGVINLKPYQNAVDREIMPIFESSRRLLSFYSHFPRVYFDLLKRKMVETEFIGYSDFKEDSDWLGAKCQEYVQNLPSSLSDLGKESFRRLPWNPCHFSVVLPFWVGDIYHLPRNVIRSVALPSCLASYYVFLQDRIMDESSGEWEKLSPFGIVMFTEMMRQYQALFPADSPFWDYLEQYITEWTQSVSWEEASHWDKLRDYRKEDFLLIARKAAILKLSAMPVALLAGYEEAVELLAQLVDYTQVVYDLIDQLQDWREDLQARHYGYLLTKVILRAGWSESTPPPEDFVQRAFLFTDALESTLHTARKYAQLARDCAVRLKGRYLIGYADSMIQYCDLLSNQWVVVKEQAFNDIVEAK